MKQKCPLFIYDCDGTLTDFTVRVWAVMKSKSKDYPLSLADFKARHNDAKTILVPGMDDLIKYTASIGNNVLISGGDPVNNGPDELKKLLPLFQNWTHNGEPVSLGREPNGSFKDSPAVAESLLKTFEPSMVVVIGDSDSERRLAQNIQANALFLRASSQASLEGLDTIPHKHIIQDGNDIQPILKEIVEKTKPRQQHSFFATKRNQYT